MAWYTTAPAVGIVLAALCFVVWQTNSSGQSPVSLASVSIPSTGGRLLLLEKKLHNELAAAVRNVADSEEKQVVMEQKRLGMPAKEVQVSGAQARLSAARAFLQAASSKERIIQRLADDPADDTPEAGDDKNSSIARMKEELGKQESRFYDERQKRLVAAMVRIEQDIAASGSEDAVTAKHSLQWKQAEEMYEQEAFHNISAKEENRTEVEPKGIEAFANYAESADNVSGVPGYKALLDASYAADKNRTQMWNELLDRYRKEQAMAIQASDQAMEPAAESTQQHPVLRDNHEQEASLPHPLLHTLSEGASGATESNQGDKVQLVRAKETFSFEGMVALKAGAEAVLLKRDVADGVDQIATAQGEVGLFPASDLAEVHVASTSEGASERGVARTESADVQGPSKLNKQEEEEPLNLLRGDLPGHGVRLISRALERAKNEYLADRAREIAKSSPSAAQHVDLEQDGRDAVSKALAENELIFRNAKRAEIKASYEHKLFREQEAVKALQVEDLKELHEVMNAFKEKHQSLAQQLEESGFWKSFQDAMDSGIEGGKNAIMNALNVTEEFAKGLINGHGHSDEENNSTEAHGAPADQAAAPAAESAAPAEQAQARATVANGRMQARATVQDLKVLHELVNALKERHQARAQQLAQQLEESGFWKSFQVAMESGFEGGKNAIMNAFNVTEEFAKGLINGHGPSDNDDDNAIDDAQENNSTVAHDAPADQAASPAAEAAASAVGLAQALATVANGREQARALIQDLKDLHEMMHALKEKDHSLAQKLEESGFWKSFQDAMKSGMEGGKNAIMNALNVTEEFAKGLINGHGHSDEENNSTEAHDAPADQAAAPAAESAASAEQAQARATVANGRLQARATIVKEYQEDRDDEQRQERLFQQDREREKEFAGLAHQERVQEERGEEEKIEEQEQEQRIALKEAESIIHAHDSSIPISKVISGYSHEVSQLEGEERARDGLTAVHQTGDKTSK